MATYLEIFDLQNDDNLRYRVYVATLVAAQAKLVASPTAGEAAWVRKVLSDPQGEGHRVLRLILAANVGATVAQIRAASDNTIQTHVNNVVNGLVLGG